MRAIVAAAILAFGPGLSGGHSSSAVPTRDETPVPILIYHVIADPPAGAPFPELYVSPKAFSAQVSWLARHGFMPSR